MMLWQEKWVTYLEGAHSFAIICTPWVLDIFIGLVFLICFIRKRKKLHRIALTFCVVRFMLILHSDDLKNSSVC